MKYRSLCLLLGVAAMLVGCHKTDPSKPSGTGLEVMPDPDDKPSIPVAERTGESGITYQLLVYSFADSDGDGIGDFKGIESKLDYLKTLGVQALWLSPIHPCASYHGYDVTDYTTVNPEYGTEADFKSLLDAAHAKGIKVYLDYVLNHTSINHPWFTEARKGSDNPYYNYYILSGNPQQDIAAGKIPMIATEGAAGYDSGQWYTTTTAASAAKVKFTLTCNASDQPQTLKIERVESISNSGGATSGKYLWWGDPGRNSEFYSQGGGVYTLSLELDSPWGVLIRTSTTQWDSYKWGAKSGAQNLQWGTALALTNSDGQDILLPDMGSVKYHSHFWTASFADLNYGPAASCETSPAFVSVTDAAKKWISMGVDGFRLDAIKHIYHNASTDENPTFLKKFYDSCNAAYKAAGHSDNIYMVGEHFSEAREVAPYYKGLPAFFEFSFWWRLSEALSSGNASSFVSTIQGYRKSYASYRSDFVEATKLSNHDENRTGSTLGRSLAKMKLAGAVLLTGPGEPYIYQGEELGYWGETSGGDEYVRSPIQWYANGSSLASAKLGGKLDKSMLSGAISVETQSGKDDSILSVYRTFGVLRDSYPALAKGSFDTCSFTGPSSVCAWYREYNGQKLLVVHNFGGASVEATFSDSLTTLVASNGSVSTKAGKTLSLGAWSSAVYLLK